MTLHKQKLLKDFEFLNLPKEIINKIESNDMNVYESYLFIIDYINYTINKDNSI